MTPDISCLQKVFLVIETDDVTNEILWVSGYSNKDKLANHKRIEECHQNYYELVLDSGVIDNKLTIGGKKIEL